MSARNSYVGVVAAFAAIGGIFASSTGARTLDYPLAVSLSGLSPTHATEGQLVTISGSHLENAKSVTFGTVTAGSITVDPNGLWIKAVVPAGLPNGPVQISVTVEGLSPMIGPFEIGAASVSPAANPQAGGKGLGVAVATPRITQFSPTSGKAGTKVTINGANFSGATWLKFGGVTARFTVSSANWIIAIVPKHAHSGKITIHTKGGTAVSGTPFNV